MFRCILPPPGRGILPFALVLALGFVAGCQGWGTVKGKITYKDKPIPGGSITFLGSDGKSYAGPVEKDGTYSVRVPSGEAKVVISCIDDEAMVKYTKALAAGGRGGRDPSKPPPKPPKMSPSGSFSLVPEKYADLNASDLKVTVKAGENTQDFPLKD